jgi:hypothetical protein
VLSLHDDLPLHQTPATLDHPASSDPAVYERFYFGFCDVTGAEAVGMTFNLHPNKGLVDAAFTMSTAGRHESLMVSDHLGHDRADLRCGPVRLTLEEPMRRLRIRIEGHADFDADITFVATAPAIEEPRVTRLRSSRVVQDRSRYVQLGVLDGHVSGPLGSFELTEERWRGGRDHSWGIWDAPKQHTSESKEASPSFFWLIGAFDDWALQAVTHQDADGTPYGEYAAVCPTLAAGAEPAGPGALQQSRPLLSFEPRFPDGSWHFTDATATIGGPSGEAERLRLESLHVMLPRAVGYAHPTWVSGTVHQPLPRVERDGWTLAGEDLLDRHNHRALQFVRMTRSDGAVGFGVTDQCVSVARAAAR